MLSPNTTDNNSHDTVLNRCHRCLVTGASGYIGRPLCEYLKKQGLFVRAVLRSENSLNIKNSTKNNAKNNGSTDKIACDETVYCDLSKLIFDNTSTLGNPLDRSNTSVLKNGNASAFSHAEENTIANPESLHIMNSIDTVFHLAGIAHASSSLNISKDAYFQINFHATEQLMHLAHQAGVKRFIYFSSVKAENPQENDFYGQSKHAAEVSVLALGEKYQMHVTVIRPALVYGPNVKGNLATMIRGIEEGWFPRLPETFNKRSLVSLQDLLEVTKLVAETPEASGKIYIITDGQSYSSKQLYDAIRQALGKSSIRWTIPYSFFKCMAMLGDLLQNLFKRHLPFNSEKLDKLLGSAEYSNHAIQNDLKWSPKVNLLSNPSYLLPLPVCAICR